MRASSLRLFLCRKGHDSTPHTHNGQACDYAIRKRSGDLRLTDEASIGKPAPLGATISDNGVNFAVRSEGADAVELILFAENPGVGEPAVQILPMNRTGHVWHRFVAGRGHGTQYLYRVHGDYKPAVDGSRFNDNMALLDPYSKAVTGDSSRPVAYDDSDRTDPDRHLRKGMQDALAKMSRSVVVDTSSFDWEGVTRPNTPLTDAVIYEMNVKGFTAGLPMLGNTAGTYLGVVAMIPHLKRLGVTHVELMPVQQYEKVDTFNGAMGDNPINPVTGEPLRNQWGYQPIAYQAPEASYAADGTHGQQVNEFKYMVRELNRNGIDVIGDIVFNHTAEDGHLGPTISFRGLDNRVYYMLSPESPDKYIDHTGCRNTLNVNHPVVQDLIIDTLKYWHKELGLTGFRFDLATIFNYDVDNVDKARTPILERIASDPDLRDVQLIAEPWSVDQYKVGRFWPTRWAEWNGVYRDTVRRFLKSDSGQLADLSERITGSRRWFKACKDRHSINFVTAHDGFTLNDLVSYNDKHNKANGEDNRDGANDNYSWNHGVEGPVDQLPTAQAAAIESLRNRQVKNAFAMLFLSQGTPMMLAGDEFRRTAHGNNNYWNQEKLNILDWKLLEKHGDITRFVEKISALRREFQLGRGMPEDVTWHGTRPYDQYFEQDGRYIAWDVPAAAVASEDAQHQSTTKKLYCGFNAYWEPLTITLPEGKWRRRMDTNLKSGDDIVDSGAGPEVDGTYTVAPRSAVVFEAVASDR